MPEVHAASPVPAGSPAGWSQPPGRRHERERLGDDDGVDVGRRVVARPRSRCPSRRGWRRSPCSRRRRWRRAAARPTSRRRSAAGPSRATVPSAARSAARSLQDARRTGVPLHHSEIHDTQRGRQRATRGRGYHRADPRAPLQAPRPARPSSPAARGADVAAGDRVRIVAGLSPQFGQVGHRRARRRPQRHRRARPAVRRVGSAASGSTTATRASSRPSPGSAAWARRTCSPTTRLS